MSTRTDKRARLTVKGLSGVSGLSSTIQDLTPAYRTPFEGPGAALTRTNGILFPFTPSISYAQQVEYSQYDLVHTNYQQNAYSRTRNPNLQITGTFASQTPDEAIYTMGVIHFLRVVSKMNFGNRDEDAGTPPPVLEFSAYGAYNFNRVPVLLGSFSYVLEDGVDYIEVSTAGETVQIPTMLVISMDLLPQYSPSKQLEFNLNDFASGNGYRRGFI